MKKIQGGITAAKGFEAAAVATGIKYENRLDLALIYSEKPCKIAGTFTTNIIKATPVKWDQAIVEGKKKCQAVVVNAGIANACTGEEGMQCCVETAQTVANALNLEREEILIGSTGVIGMPMPMEKLKKGIEILAKKKAKGYEAGKEAARAIMTTDTCEKEIAVTFEIDGQVITIGGMAKGSGMIHPNMCTMLSFITTDACISKKALQQALRMDVEETYNMISVDGDTSTNDTVLLLANGMAGNKKIKYGTKEWELFCDALHEVNLTLAKKIAEDGEGATALLEVIVEGASSKEQARKLAKSVICSNLTKTAIAGHDANWGRILCAMGYAGVEFFPERTHLSIKSKEGELCLVEGGVAVSYSEEKATKILSEPEVTVLIHIGEGEETATAWGCDLTHGYIDINADYRS